MDATRGGHEAALQESQLKLQQLNQHLKDKDAELHDMVEVSCGA